MAIKGKRKTRGGRAVTPAPRPQLVVRKPPIWRRTVTLVVVGVLAAGAIGFGVWRSISHDREAALKQREIAAVTKYNAMVSANYPADQRPLGSQTLEIFVSVPAQVEAIRKGTLSGAKAKAAGTKLQDAATKAADAIGRINVSGVIPSELEVGETPAEHTPGLTSITLTDSQLLMVEAFKLYENVGALMSIAADNPQGPQRSAIIAQAKGMVDDANAIFSRGYGKLQNVRGILGILPTTPLPVPTAASQVTP